jgi:hypothetical protein
MVSVDFGFGRTKNYERKKGRKKGNSWKNGEQLAKSPPVGKKNREVLGPGP